MYFRPIGLGLTPHSKAMPDFAVFNLAAGQSMKMAPLGALYIVAAAEDAGFSTVFRDYALERGPDLFRIDRIAEFLETADAPVVGISCFAGMLPYGVLAVEKLRACRPEIKIVFGGPGPSAVAKELLETFPAIDFVVCGEGEETAVDLLRFLAKGSPPAWTIPGLAWRAANSVVTVNSRRERRRELDQIVFPEYDRVNLQDYDVVGVVYARGCPYTCTYCDVVSMWNRQNIARSVDNVLAEIEWLRGCGVRHIAFVDDLFTVNRKRTIEFCDRFESAGVPASWGCTTRIDRVDSELLDRMAAAGCQYVFYGVESGSPAVLARVNKAIPFEQTADAVRQSARLGMYTHTPLMWGFPFETMSDFHQTLAFGQYLNHCGANVFYSLVTPLPGTALYEEFRDRLTFRPDVYSTIIAPGREANLAEVAETIAAFPSLFSGFYHFSDGMVDEKSRIGKRLGLNLSDIRIDSLSATETGCAGSS